MSAHCGAKTRTGTRCRANAMPNGKCRLHGGKPAPKRKKKTKPTPPAGYYTDALLPDERHIYERAVVGNVDAEIRLAKVKLHRFVRLTGAAALQGLVESALEALHTTSETPAKTTRPAYDKKELKAAAQHHADMILKQIDLIGKMETRRMQLLLAQRRLDEHSPATGREIAGFEVIPYDEAE